MIIATLFKEIVDLIITLSIPKNDTTCRKLRWNTVRGSSSPCMFTCRADFVLRFWWSCQGYLGHSHRWGNSDWLEVCSFQDQTNPGCHLWGTYKRATPEVVWDPNGREIKGNSHDTTSRKNSLTSSKRFTPSVVSHMASTVLPLCSTTFYKIDTQFFIWSFSTVEQIHFLHMRGSFWSLKLEASNFHRMADSGCAWLRFLTLNAKNPLIYACCMLWFTGLGLLQSMKFISGMQKYRISSILSSVWAWAYDLLTMPNISCFRSKFVSL